VFTNGAAQNRCGLKPGARGQAGSCHEERQGRDCIHFRPGRPASRQAGNGFDQVVSRRAATSQFSPGRRDRRPGIADAAKREQRWCQSRERNSRPWRRCSERRNGSPGTSVRAARRHHDEERRHAHRHENLAAQRVRSTSDNCSGTAPAGAEHAECRAAALLRYIDLREID